MKHFEDHNKQEEGICYCRKEDAIVTYDLAVAKLALQMPEEAPLFDNVLVWFGTLHIILAYFSAIGHIIAESAGPQALVETSVLASGSLNGFITRKDYYGYMYCLGIH